MGKKVTKFLEVILGLVLIVFGANGFLQFMTPPQFNSAASDFLGALFATGYIFPLMSIIWIIAGILLLIHKARAFAVILIFPISINLMLFHLALDSAQIVIPLVVFLINVYLIWAYFKVYRPLFK
jgi:hypothetical protein